MKLAGESRIERKKIANKKRLKAKKKKKKRNAGKSNEVNRV